MALQTLLKKNFSFIKLKNQTSYFRRNISEQRRKHCPPMSILIWFNGVFFGFLYIYIRIGGVLLNSKQTLSLGTIGLKNIVVMECAHASGKKFLIPPKRDGIETPVDRGNINHHRSVALEQ